MGQRRRRHAQSGGGAADGTLYVGLITSGNVLRKRPGQVWETSSPALTRCSPQTRCGWTNSAGCCGELAGLFSGGKTRANRIYALNVADGPQPQPGAAVGEMSNDIVLGADGTVYVTETRGGGILRLRPGETAFSTLYRDPQLAAPSGLGAAGIVLFDDRLMAVANFGTGKLYPSAITIQSRS